MNERLCDHIWKRDELIVPTSPDDPGTIQNVTFCGDGSNIGNGVNVNIGCINIGPNVVAMKEKFNLLKDNMHKSLMRKGVQQTEEEYVEKWSNDMSRNNLLISFISIHKETKEENKFNFR